MPVDSGAEQVEDLLGIPSPAIFWVDKRITVGGMAMRKSVFWGRKEESSKRRTTLC